MNFKILVSVSYEFFFTSLVVTLSRSMYFMKKKTRLINFINEDHSFIGQANFSNKLTDNF